MINTELNTQYNLISMLLNKIQEYIEKNDLSHLDRDELITNSPFGVLLINEKNEIIFINYAYEIITGFSFSDLNKNEFTLNIERYKLNESHKTFLNALSENKSIHLEFINNRKDGSEFWADISITPVESNSKCFFKIIVLNDITSRKKLEASIVRKEKFLEAVTQATEKLLTVKNFDDSIKQALEILGNTTDVDRIYIYKKFTDENNKTYITQEYEWLNYGIFSQKENKELQKSNSNEAYIDWLIELENKKVISGNCSEFPEEKQPLLKILNILSLALAPIIIEDNFWGFLGFDYCRMEKSWEKSELDILLAMAASFGGAIKNHETAQMLINATEFAKKNSNAKSEFLANMSHEIRTPLNTILGVIQLFEETTLSPEQLKYLSIQKSAGNNLMSIINDILEISRIESGIIRYNEVTFSINELIDELQLLFSTKLSDKNLELKFIKNDFPDNLNGDREKLRQILVNLISNSIKFTEVGGISVSLQVTTRNESDCLCRFSISDTGIGIPENIKEIIFDRFIQADSSSVKKYSGTGLGLSIVKAYTDFLKGSISFVSEENKGATFYLDLPFRIPESFSTNNFISSNNKTITAALEENKKYNILVVDDSEDNRFLIEAFLKKLSLNIDFALDGEEAYSKTISENYDLILMDMQMPIVDGYTSTKMIRKWEKDTNHIHIPIIALTAYAYKEDVKKSIDAGCDLHVTKPINKKILIEVICKYLNKG